MRHVAAIPRLPLRRRLPVMEAALGAVAAMGLEPFGFWPATPVAFGLALLVMVVHLTVGLAWSGTTVSG